MKKSDEYEKEKNWKMMKKEMENYVAKMINNQRIKRKEQGWKTWKEIDKKMQWIRLRTK